MALIATEGVLFGQVDTVSDTIPKQYNTVPDTIPKQYDYFLDSPPEEYYIPPVQTPAVAPKTAETNPPAVGAENFQPLQDDAAAPPPAAADTLTIRAPRSQEEMGRMPREELYRLAFRRAAPERPRSLVMRFFAEGQAFGNTEIVYDSAFASFNFVSAQFSRWLDTLLLPEARAAAGDSGGYFNSAVLEAAGYAVSLNELQYEMRVDVPPEGKILQRTALGGGYARQPAGPEVKPAAASFYMNWRVEERLSYADYRYGSGYDRTKYDDYGSRDPFGADFDGALNVCGWVFESSARFGEPYGGRLAKRENFSRGDARLVRDIVPWRVRATAGDVDLGSDLLSYGGGVGGLRWEYNDWFFGGEPASARAKITFFMPRAGEAELYMDGRFQQRFRLPAGNHEISGFGGEVGRNKVRLVLRMDDGGVEEIPYEFVLGDPRNMLQGEARYSAAAGVRRVYAPAPMTYDYAPKEPAAGADILYGLLPSVSTGAAAQASRENVLAAAQALWNMGGPGWLNARAAASRGTGARGYAGGRGELNYTADLGAMVKALDSYFFEGRGTVPNMSLSLRGYYKSLRYSERLFDLGADAGNADMAGFSGNYGFGMLRGSVTANGGATLHRDIPGVSDYYPYTWNYGLRVSQSVMRATFSVNAGADVRGGVHRLYFSAFTNYALGARLGRNHQLSASGDVSMRSSYVEPYRRTVYYPNTAASGYDLDGDSIAYGYDYNSNTIPLEYDYVSNTIPLEYDYASNTIPYEYDYNANTIPLEYDYVSNTIPYEYDYNANTIPLEYDYNSNIIQSEDDSLRPPYDADTVPYYYEDVKGHNDYRMSYGANAGWRWSNGSGGSWAQSYSASVGLRDRWGIPGVGASANNSFNRAQTWLDYGMADYAAGGYGRMSHSLRASAAGSFMFADGLWALGRPTNGNYLLVGTGNGLRGAKARVNRSRLSRLDFSSGGWLGAAYQNYLMSYRPTDVDVSVTGAAPGAPLESGVYHVNGAYKRGHALRLGGKPETIVQVRLTGGGVPLRYAYATVEPDGGRAGQERRATFSGGDGVLQIGGLAPGGRYRLKFNRSAYIKDIIIEIPKNAGPVTELPDMEVERE